MDDVRDVYSIISYVVWFFFQAEDGIRDLVRSRGLGDVYKRQELPLPIRTGQANLLALRVPLEPA